MSAVSDWIDEQDRTGRLQRTNNPVKFLLGWLKCEAKDLIQASWASSYDRYLVNLLLDEANRPDLLPLYELLLKASGETAIHALDIIRREIAQVYRKPDQAIDDHDRIFDLLEEIEDHARALSGALRRLDDQEAEGLFHSTFTMLANVAHAQHLIDSISYTAHDAKIKGQPSATAYISLAEQAENPTRLILALDAALDRYSAAYGFNVIRRHRKAVLTTKAMAGLVRVVTTKEANEDTITNARRKTRNSM